MFCFEELISKLKETKLIKLLVPPGVNICEVINTDALLHYNAFKNCIQISFTVYLKYTSCMFGKYCQNCRKKAETKMMPNPNTEF